MEVLIKSVQEIIRTEGPDVFCEPYRFWAITEDLTGGQYKQETDLLCWLSNGDHLHELERVCRTSDDGQRQQLLRTVYQAFVEKGDKTAANNLMGALCAAFEWKPPAGVPTISRSAVSTGSGRAASDVQRSSSMEMVSGRTSTGGQTGSGRISIGGQTGSGRTSTGGQTGGSRTSTSRQTGSGRTSTGGQTGGNWTSTGGQTGGSRTSTGRQTGSGRTSTGGQTGGNWTSTGGQTSGGQGVQAKTYRTIFYAENGDVLSSVYETLGSHVRVPVPPAVTGKRFLMWSPTVSGDSVTVNGNQEYRAIYARKSPIIPILITVILCVLVGGWKILSNVGQSDIHGTAAGVTGQVLEQKISDAVIDDKLNSYINISEGGFMIQLADYIYYTNPTDSYKIYRTTKDFQSPEQISDIGAFYLHFINGKIYFARSDEDRCIYSINPDGTNLTKINDQPSYEPKIVGEYIYYDDFDDGYSMWRCKLDGSNVELVNNTATYYSCFVNNKIYYLSPYENYKCYSMNLNGKNKQVFSDESYRELCVVDDVLYFSKEGRGIVAYDTKTGRRWYVNHDISARSMNVCGNWIYYNDTGRDGKLFRIEASRDAVPELLSEKHPSFINVSSDGELLSFQDGEDSGNFFWYVVSEERLISVE